MIDRTLIVVLASSLGKNHVHNLCLKMKRDLSRFCCYEVFVHGRPPAIIIGKKFEKMLKKITSLYAGYACY